LLKKSAFVWSKATKQAFFALKDATCTTPILEVLAFANTFVLELNSFSRDLGVVLMQEGCPSTFTDRHSCDNKLGKSTYEKEMMAILHVVET